MIVINITNNSIEVQGHGRGNLCSIISTLSQYVSSCLKINSYKSEYGYLKADFEYSNISKLLLEKMVIFIKDLKSTEVYLIDNRSDEV